MRAVPYAGQKRVCAVYLLSPFGIYALNICRTMCGMWFVIYYIIMCYVKVFIFIYILSQKYLRFKKFAISLHS